MSRIFVTGDTHQSIDISKLNMKNFPIQKELTKDDYVIICGDFGMVWDNSKEELWWRKWLDERNFTTLFVDGNHDCVFHETDILTSEGWMNVVDLYYSENIKIANFDIDTGEIFFDWPKNKFKSYKDKAVEIKGKNTNQTVSLNHDVIIDNQKVKAHELVGKTIKERQFRLKGSQPNNRGVDISDNMIKLLTWTIMDATIIDHSKYNPNSKKCTVQFKLSKVKKIEELKLLLEEMSIAYTFKKATKSSCNVLQPYYIRIYSDDARMIYYALNKSKTIPNIWRNFNEAQVKTFLETLEKTDGHKRSVGNKPITWRTIDLNSVNIVQEMCIKNNIYCSYSTKKDASGFKKNQTQYISVIYYEKQLNLSVDISIIPYNDYMYCFEMPHGTLITRNNGKVAFTGNCHPLLNQYPVSEWNGGKVHFINDSIIHLMRGQVFTINNKKFFTMGGATSIDKMYRTEGKTWWAEEIPSKQELHEGLDNLDIHNWEVNYVLSHTTSNRLMQEMGYQKENNAINSYFDMLEQDLKYEQWYFGHFHNDEQYGKHRLLYYDIVEII